MPSFLFSTPTLAAYTIFISVTFGLAMGSFLNCMAWRMTHGKSVLNGRSHCPDCGHVLGFLDLIPIVSWLASRGKCRYCGEPIPKRYPLTELACAALYLLIVWRFDFSLETLEMLGFASVLFVVTLTDLDDYLIPNSCIVAALVIRALYVLGMWAFFHMDPTPFVKFSLIGMAAVGIPLLIVVLIMDKVLGRPSMGGGDLKLFVVAGAYFGWQQTIFLVIVACILGIIFGFVFQRRAKDEGEGVPKKAFPFGPAIAAACLITMFVGQDVLFWYMGLLM